MGLISHAPRFLYLLVLVLLFAWALPSYTQAAWGYKGLWSSVPRLDSVDAFLHKPLILLDSRIEGDQLVVQLLRTYAEPGAEELLLVAELNPLGGEVVRMEVRKRVALGTLLSFAFPLIFTGEQLAAWRIEVYLSGRLVAAKEGCWG